MARQSDIGTTTLQEPPTTQGARNVIRHSAENMTEKVAYGEAILKNNQAIRDALFKDLKANTSQYTFDYVVINLPPGTLPGIRFSIPVSHVRYSDTVFFEFDRFSIESSAEVAVSDFAKIMMKDRSYRSILVVGHTDAVGTDDYNNTLSRNRAATVATALRALGVRDNSLGIVPMGKAQPMATNSTPACRARNRRVEFFISDIPAATKKAIERIPYNPCFRSDNEPNSPSSGCTGGPTTVPILPASGEGRPITTLDLSRSALPVNVNQSREPLPKDVLERPSIKQLQP